MNKQHLLPLFLGLALAACATSTKKTAPPRPSEPEIQVHAPIAPSFAADQIVSLAISEWTYFGSQLVVFKDDEEMIPHVGFWEDDDLDHIDRVKMYWRAVGRPKLSGVDCRQPWSAAFISWVMREAGIGKSLFPPADAHWVYLVRMMNQYGSDAPFLAHAIQEYRPRPGDLICATRGPSAPLFDELPQMEWLKSTKLHCDIVVENSGGSLAAIGGNVRNSVSKSILRLTPDGHLQPTRSRPWFVVLENRLDR